MHNGKMVFCEVKFDNNPNGVYYSGQTLSGVIEITNEKQRKINAVTLRIEGYAKCKWSETRGSGRNRRTIVYSGREDYINTVSYLVRKVDGVDAELSAGLHKFNFACPLPFNLPTSFESKYGHIRYQIKVDIERPWKLDLKYSFGFTVIKVYDLNYDSPALKTPLKVETTKNFFLGLSSKSVYISSEIPTRGFVAGQSVPITIATNNESNIDVKEIKVSLKKIILYNSQTPSRKVRERVESTSEIRHAGVQRKSKESVVVEMIFPAVPPTTVTLCSLIQVSYFIQIVAKVGGIHFSPILRMPVTIGTVPLQMLYQPNPPTFNSIEAAPGPVPSAPLVMPSPSNQELPPPSYQEAMGMTSHDADNDEGLTEDKPFAPLYPVINFGTTTFSHNFLENASSTPYGREKKEK
ncbi:Arrestin domain-containing protein 3 [Pseudolycoriella hygida]|uniref:Arrestin domain-containing protein 3 n=1 Tax=Pseudolycoriella hygida TaxID=35572 RepID=A0A9Q0RW93_9DIPT|nr:Arrestin domain-containing protein 3 [Pseudolycoriella hygida]